MEVIQEGSGAELVAEIQAAPRSLVFISVPWSGPERNARQAFRAAVCQLEESSSELGICFFRLEVDEDEISQKWLSSIGFLPFASAGAGSLLWLKAGQVISSEISVNSIGVKGIVDRTTFLWKSKCTDAF